MHRRMGLIEELGYSLIGATYAAVLFGGALFLSAGAVEVLHRKAETLYPKHAVTVTDVDTRVKTNAGGVTSGHLVVSLEGSDGKPFKLAAPIHVQGKGPDLEGVLKDALLSGRPMDIRTNFLGYIRQATPSQYK